MTSVLIIFTYLLDEMSVLVGSSLLFTHTMFRWYQSVYINVFSTTATVNLLDWVSPYIYTLCAGLTIISEAPALDGSGRGKERQLLLFQYGTAINCFHSQC